MENHVKAPISIGAFLLLFLLISTISVVAQEGTDFKKGVSISLSIASFELEEPEHFYDSWGGGFSYQNHINEKAGIKVGFHYLQSFNREVNDIETPLMNEQSFFDSFVRSTSEFYTELEYNLFGFRNSTIGISAGLGVQIFRRMEITSTTIIRVFDDQTGELIDVSVEDEINIESETLPGIRAGAFYLFKVSERVSLGPEATFRVYQKGGNIWEFGLTTSIFL